MDDAEEPVKKSFAETFEEAFPQYLALGMTAGEFWEQDCRLVIAYRKAYQIKQEHENQFAWLQGLYICKALQSVPQFVAGWMPKNVQIDPYFDKPIDFTPKKKSKKESNQQKMDDTAKFMMNLMNRFNTSRHEKEVREQQI